MPELPEVETVRRGLAPLLEGETIAAATAFRPDLRFPFPDRFAERLVGRRIGTLGRRAKYLLLPLDSGETLVIHLGMSGRLLVEGPEAASPGRFHRAIDRLPAHDHVEIRLGSGRRLVYNDVRRFGFFNLVAGPGEAAFPDLGPEPLGIAFSAATLASALAGRRGPIKPALLDQKIVAGLGNIYVCEALHRAGISPARPAGGLSEAETLRLVAAIRAVLEEAIAAGGSTLRDYRHEDGSLGYFQHAFAVYDREGEGCTRPGCGGSIVRSVQAGRSTFACDTCPN